MRTCCLTLALVAACGVRVAPPPPSALAHVSGTATTVADFERTARLSLHKAGVSALAVAIINDSKVVYAGQFGWKDQDNGTTLDDSTLFAGGSLSKPIVAYLALLLAQQGAINLDAPLRQYLPQPLSQHDGYQLFESDPRHRIISARMALNHTSGLPNLRSSEPNGQIRIHLQPGAAFRYSGEGFKLLQLALENVTRTDLQTLARQKVFEPLGMRHTSFVWGSDFAANVAAPHNEFGWAAEPDRPLTADAAGSLITTARDYAAFVVRLLADERDPAGVTRAMWTPHVRITSSRMGAVNESPSVASDRKSLSWALGWGTFQTPNGRAVFHTGHKAGVQNYVVVFPERGIGMVLLSNSDNFESVAPEIVAAGIGDHDSPFDWLGYERFDPAKRKTPPPRPVAIRLPASLLSEYAGVYELAPGAVFHVRANGDRLYASDDVQSWDELFARSEDTFFFKGRTLTLRFVRDGKGSVTRVEIDNNGTRMIAGRIK